MQEIIKNATYTSKDLSKILKISTQTASKIIREKEIKAVKVGIKYLILGKDILEYLEGKAGVKTRLNNYIALLQQIEKQGFNIDLTVNNYVLSKNNEVCFKTENIKEIQEFIKNDNS
jgi:excisionase family DNA binding protein